ncbi:hypothetical protein B296_00019430 [Ensete ventricosum]|uniref:Uncharacterized protein n=1 Tax=Ensete ventricosum TaxID=4639 RepID=A0A426ZMK5_ENSVE|nr:hypothetical protein B296_00019430 [Ensete ventricosum]
MEKKPHLLKKKEKIERGRKGERKEKKKKGAPHLPPSSSPAPAVGRRRLSHCLPYYCRRPPFPLLPATTTGHHTPIFSVAAADTPAASSHRSSLSSSATHSHRLQPSSLSHNCCHPSSTASVGHLCHPFSSPLLSRRPPSPSPPQPQPQPHPPRPLLHLRIATFFLRCPVATCRWPLPPSLPLSLLSSSFPLPQPLPDCRCLLPSYPAVAVLTPAILAANASSPSVASSSVGHRSSSSSSPPTIHAISHFSRCNPLLQPPSHSRL